MGHAIFPQEIPGINPAGVGVAQLRMVIPLQCVMAAVHQHGKALHAAVHLPDQNGVAVAHIDKIQYQHARPPCEVVVSTITHLWLSGNASPPPAAAKISRGNFSVLTKKSPAGIRRGILRISLLPIPGRIVTVRRLTGSAVRLPAQFCPRSWRPSSSRCGRGCRPPQRFPARPR